MKPDWKDAPEWAKWIALSTDGEWTWFEDEPWRDSEGDYMPGPKGAWAPAGRQAMLERRP
ncbi:hypothetical protein [Stenotrophomonas phage SOVA965]